MPILLALSGVTAILTAGGHSWLGERHILRPLSSGTAEVGVLRKPVNRRLLRAVWHLPSVIWAVLGAATVALAASGRFDARFLIVFGAIYAASAACNFFAVRGPHVGQALLLATVGLMALSFV
ncbi:MAG: hypothetical protein PVI23_08260 [Maricaulaceae bacterium]|jgi:hypothetical protein